jgi:hypothetical protein
MTLPLELMIIHPLVTSDLLLRKKALLSRALDCKRLGANGMHG